MATGGLKMLVQTLKPKDRIPATWPLLHVTGPPESPCRGNRALVTLLPTAGGGGREADSRAETPAPLSLHPLSPDLLHSLLPSFPFNSLCSFFPPQGLCTCSIYALIFLGAGVQTPALLLAM